ncbi:12749_t:CDS:2, partial [Gigaspora margarita]
VKSETEKEAETTPERDLIATTEMEPTITTLSRKVILELLECGTTNYGTNKVQKQIIDQELKQTNEIEELVKNRHKEVTTKETNNSLVQKKENLMEISFGPDSRSLKESITDIKGWRELFIKKNLTEIEQWKTKEIPFRKVTIDKYISKNGLNNKVILDPEEVKLKVNTTLAFADDTTWVAENKEQMEETIKIAKEFFEINDIQINTKKSKLLVLNRPKKREPNMIKLCGSLVQEEKQNLITRFLGIWISNNYRETLIKARARGIFSLLEEKIIENAKERTIKPKWISRQANQFGSSVSLLEISNDKRKKEWVLSEEGEAFKIKEKKEKTIQVEHWKTVSEVAKLEKRIEKCLGCEHNRSIVEGNCTTRIRFDVARETYNKDPLENEQEFKNLHSLESPEKELILQAKLKEELKEEILAILTKNLNCQKKKYCYYTDGSLQKDNKDKGSIAVMEVAVVQIDEKEY